MLAASASQRRRSRPATDAAGPAPAEPGAGTGTSSAARMRASSARSWRRCSAQRGHASAWDRAAASSCCGSAPAIRRNCRQSMVIRLLRRPRPERPAQLVPGTEQARQNGRLRQAELVGDFLRRKSHQHLQHERLTVVVLQGKDGAAHVRRLLVRGRGELGGLACHELVHRHGVVPLALVETRVLAADDGQQPRLGGPGFREPVPRCPGPEQGFLHDVLRYRPVARQPEGEAVQVGAQLVAEPREGDLPVLSGKRRVHV